MRKADINLVRHIISYFFLAFLIISFFGFFLFLASRVVLAYLKSQAYGLDFFRIFYIDFILLLYAAPVFIAYIFSISLILTVHHLHKNGFFTFYAGFGYKARFLTASGFFIAALFSLMISLFPQNLLSKLNDHIIQEASEINFSQLISELEPLNFYHYKDWVFYISDIPYSCLFPV